MTTYTITFTDEELGEIVTQLEGKVKRIKEFYKFKNMQIADEHQITLKFCERLIEKIGNAKPDIQ